MCATQMMAALVCVVALVIDAVLMLSAVEGRGVHHVVKTTHHLNKLYLQVMQWMRWMVMAVEL